MAVRDIWAVVPVKEFAQAKQRLSPLLQPAQRAALARAMLEDVLSALAASPLGGIVLNTLERAAAELGRRYGARVVALDAGAGHTGAVTAAASMLAAEGREAMLACPGDIPAMTADEVAVVIAEHQAAPAFTIVPAHDRRGSNMVVMSPPGLMRLRFGDDSFEPHVEEARRIGLRPRILELPGIALDIDAPEDVWRFLRSGAGPATRARVFLEQFAVRS